ncbi:MAG: helix-turn-helix domain-containing protein, partial [Nitrospirae bacterium]|nr:helix-turn-helix domain-containing protein [Nitrospirota bacterium]
RAFDEPMGLSQGAQTVKRLVDIRVVADYLGISPDTGYTMVSQRRIPYVKVGRLLRFDLKAIDEWITQHSVMPMPTKKP